MPSDRYVLLERLGSGGMGTVWRATDQLLARTVAVKEMHLQAAGKARTHREAHAIARISHPNVVNVYDLVIQDERLWLVMELVDGPSLKEHVAATGPMSPSDVAGIGLQLLSALEAVHAAGALHRDVKPANVLLRRDGRVVLCDFGIAALAGAGTLTESGAVVGSFEFIAPERLNGGAVGPASDLFSLGVTLCVLLGRSPFARPAPVGVLHAITEAEPELPAAAGPLRPVLEALLRKDPAARPSIAEASAMLRPFAGTDATAYDLSMPSPAPRRRRQLVGLAGIAVAALVGAAATMVALTSRSADDATAAAGGTPAARGTASPAPPSSVASEPPTRIDAVMPLPDHPKQHWMFSGDRYVRVSLTPSGYPVRPLQAPAPLGRWSDTLGLLPGFQDGVDATMRVPGSPGEYWVFSGTQYIRIRLAGADQDHDDTLVSGPRPITDWADAFGELAGGPIDAVMPVPDDKQQFWVFSGGRYVRTTLTGTGPRGRVTFGPTPLDAWTGTFGKVGEFKQGLDAVLPVPGMPNDYWVFFGTHYMKIRVTDQVYEDTVLEGPHTLRSWSTPE
ncbi:serine/threonine-protein kinase [Nonomuraea rubra]|uniref:non-specific serine/threonine protein kinase n=1 Tax=Nonomuraea rubra TaxID=46180 RepID=A0A7X0U5T7_9ACTN|nr:serine/threonine-protein kinase [Nonomuraea rubra]MBB6555840.1 hypothetical protein [Nonomuraea rubra]